MITNPGVYIAAATAVALLSLAAGALLAAWVIERTDRNR